MNHIRSIMINSALIPHGVLLWWQRKTWKSAAHPSDVFFSNNTDSKCWCAIMRSEKTHTLACNEFFGMQWITDAAARSDAMNTPATNLRHVMNYGCGSAIVCNEWRLLIRHRAVRKDTHAGLQRILRRAMNHGCGSAIVCNELRLLIRHRAVRKDTHAGLQRIPVLMAIVRSEKTHTLTCNEFRLVMWPHTLTCNEFRLVLCLGTVRDVPTDVRVEGY